MVRKQKISINLNYYKYSLFIETETWEKEACELIDYDCGNLTKVNLEIKEPGIIYRKGNQIVFYSKELNSQNYEKLLKIEKNETGFDLIPNAYEFDQNENICTPNSAWFLFKQSKFENKLSKYKINQGDIIRIGRITTRIKTIVFNGSPNTKNLENSNNLIEIHEQNKLNNKSITESSNSNINNSKKLVRRGSHKANKICRICYSEEDDEENPLIQPCICSGSMKYIHLKCLKHWINTRSFDKVDSNEICSIYIIKPVECELCKTKFPDFIRHNGKLFPLLDFQYEYKNYLTLESLTLDKHKNKFLYVISLENNGKIRLGRGHDSDILLSDISVSRIHCVISTENKNVYIEDNNSKFGTLILIQSPSIQMVENLPLYFQVGRTYFNCRYKKPSKLFQCCGVSERPNLFYYHKQNKMQVKAKTMYTVKTDVDFDEDDYIDDLDNKTINDNKSINIGESTENLGGSKNLTKKLNRGTMLFEGSEVDFSQNIIDTEENKNNNESETNNNATNQKCEKRNEENDDKENINNNENLKSLESKRETDKQSDSVFIESESLNDMAKGTDK